MAHSAITTTFTGSGNQGLQVGYNSGSIHITTADRPDTPPRPSCFVPFRRDADFVDRSTLLDQIRQRCSAPASRVPLVGLGGVGKSQLAIEHCYRTAEQSLDTWIFWAHASNTARLEQSFREIASQVRVRGYRDPQADVFKLVHDWLRDVKNGPWLFVLDNADDVAVVSPTGDGSALHDHLSQYLPSSSHGSVLVTSRTKRAAMRIVEDSDIIAVEPMHDAGARTLLRKKLRDIAEDDNSIRQLATILDCMPLALVQAAAYIRERAPRYSVRQYLDEYRKSDRRKTSLLNQEAGHLRRDQAASNSVLITWQISLDHIRHTRPSAADLLSLMSFFDRQRIQDYLLRPYIDTAIEDESGIETDDGFEDDVLALRDYSFITVTKDANTFEMHSLIQLATRTWLENAGQLDQWREQFISNLYAEMPAERYEDWEKWKALFPHARAALVQCPQSQESFREWAVVLYHAAEHALDQGRAGGAEHISVTLTEALGEVFGEEHQNTLACMSLTGKARLLGGKYKEAEKIFRHALACQEMAREREHLDTVQIKNGLAEVLSRLEKYEEAEMLLRDTLAICQKALGDEDPSTLANMNNLAMIIGRRGKSKEAEILLRKALAAMEKMLEPDHPYMLAGMTNVAEMLDRQGKYRETEALHRATLARHEKLFGHKHPDTIANVHYLACCLTSQHRYDEAFPLYMRACAGYEALFGKDHPVTRGCYTDYANAR